MKITLTEKGSEYIKQLLFDTLENSHTQLSQTKNTNGSRSQGDFSKRDLSTILLRSNVGTKDSKGKLGNQLLDTILPAMIASNPPKKINIKKPRILVSPEFQDRYLQASSVTSPSRERMKTQIEMRTLPNLRTKLGSKTMSESITDRTCQEKLYKTMQRFRQEKTPQRLRQVENAAAVYLSRTLRKNKLATMQNEINKKREEQEKIRREMMKQFEIEDLLESEGKASLIEQIKKLDEKAMMSSTFRQRHQDRVHYKHLSMINFWRGKKRLQTLASPLLRKLSMPYAKINPFARTDGHLNE